MAHWRFWLILPPPRRNAFIECGSGKGAGTDDEVGRHEFLAAMERFAGLRVHGAGAGEHLSWANQTNQCVGDQGTLEFMDAEAGKYPLRFYRLIMLVPPDSP